ncbi:MAG: hypothetical protein II956_00095 [Bacteroidales bacterium]|nr:hypothetical protein [Bacteroidales bacterium]
MKFIALILIVLTFECQAQKTDYNWVIENYIIDFNYNPPYNNPYSINMDKNANNACTLSDVNGKMLYHYSGNRLYNISGTIIYTNTMGAIMASPSLIPFPGHQDLSLFFYCSYKEGGLICKTLNHNNDKDIKLLKKLGKNYKFTFIQQEGTENIWYLSSSNNQVEVTLITKDGFQEIKTYDKKLPLRNAKISYDGSMIAANYDNEVTGKIIIFGFNPKTGEVNDIIFSFGKNYECEFSQDCKYIYAIEDNHSKIVRYDIKNSKTQTEFINSATKIYSVPNNGMEMRDIKLAPNGSIYILFNGNYLLSINKDGEFGKENRINLYGANTPYLPYTFRYEYYDEILCPKTPKIKEQK